MRCRGCSDHNATEVVARYYYFLRVVGENGVGIEEGPVEFTGAEGGGLHPDQVVAFCRVGGWEGDVGMEMQGSGGEIEDDCFGCGGERRVWRAGGGCRHVGFLESAGLMSSSSSSSITSS